MHLLTALWPYLLTAAQIAVAVFTSGHVVLHKRDVRAAIGWIGLAWLVPFGGPLLYLLFGINRIRRRATGLRGRRIDIERLTNSSVERALDSGLPVECQHLCALAQLMDRITQTPLTAGNRVTPLLSGKAAYRAMLDAIATANTSISLLAYIFDNDRLGRLFVRELVRAAERGVRVRVLVDSVGARYSRPSITALLEGDRVDVAEFLPSRFPFALPYANLRNHRKILVVDGRTGFVGSMNIRAGHLAKRPPAAIADIHFRLEGPVVRHLAETFADDWLFVRGEPRAHERVETVAAGEPPHQGNVFARGIAAGPDEALGRIRWAMLGALAVARRQVRIITPYFLPDPTMMTALMLAAMRGVRVDIVLPLRGNLRLVHWASRAKLAPLLTRGCLIWLTPPPFDHAKLMTVDGAWGFFGSANWDPRSLRLNFEFNVECYSASMVADLDGVIEERLARATAYELADDRRRSLPARLRDATAWLLSPYL